MGDECVATKRNHIAEQLQIGSANGGEHFQRWLEGLRNQIVSPDYITAYNESLQLLVHHAQECNKAAAEVQHENLCTDIDRVEGYFRRAASRARELRRLIVKPWTDEEVAVLVDMLESKTDVMQWSVCPWLSLLC
jgi:hypothetical protein